MAATKIQAIRGMRDILPGRSWLWRHLEDTVHQVLAGYGYQEIRFPIVEVTELFKRSIGEVTDIVEKEMYTFEDRNGDSLTLRPEGTAGCVRACLEHGLIHNQVQRLWYQGPMFRHERPQQGRYRQFFQIGAEVFGLPGPDIDLELLLITHRFWQQLGFNKLELQLTSLGTADERTAYRAQLTDYLRRHEQQLDEDSRRRLTTNPLRVLDSKNPEMRELIAAAPSLLEHLGEESSSHLDSVREGLDTAGIPYTLNPRLVRGLDYYARTVFEWVTDQLGAQGTVCAGGRYDGLVEQLGGRPTPAVGFAIGLERLIALLELAKERIDKPELDAYLITVGKTAQKRGLILAEGLRTRLPGLRLQSHCGGGSFKSQFKKADRSGARFALVMGEDELAKGVVGIKALRDRSEQRDIAQDRLEDFFREAGV